ncbi:MAG: hypothetical protein ACRDO2_08950 [Nocardioidaceae bacterium]
MSVEDRVTTALRDGLDRLQVTPGDSGAAMSSGARLRRRRRAVRGVAAAAAVAVAVAVGLGLTGTGEGGRPEPAHTPVGSWSELPASPLSPRTGGVAVWTGKEAIFLGGEIANHCPPNAGCTRPAKYARDGAAYDPASRTWRLIADAPVTVGYYTPHAVVGDVLVIVGDDHTWHAYDASDDAWRRLPDPPVRSELHGSALSAADGSVVSLGKGGAVLVLDLAEETWRTLPPSPDQPRVQPHTAQATTEGIVVIGVDSTARNDGTVPSYLLAEVYRDGAWHRLERSDMMGGYEWHWTGERLVAPYPACVDGGEVNPFPRCIPEGGIIDPGSGTWTPLPQGPEDLSHGWSLGTAEGRWMLVGGYLYDDADGSWTLLGAPDGFGNYSDVASVIADDTVIAFGGIDWSRNWDADDLTTNRAWIWTP